MPKNPDKRPDVTEGERYTYETKKRSTPEGRSLAALAGSKQDIRVIAAFGALILRGVEHGKLPEAGAMREYSEWLAYILGRIEGGTSPNEAFGWEQPGKAGRHQPDYQTLSRTTRLVEDGRKLAIELRKHCAKDAALKIAEIFHRDEADAIALVAELLPIKQPSINNEEACSVACHAVAAWHSANDPRAPWGRYACGTFKRLQASTLVDKVRRLPKVKGR